MLDSDSETPLNSTIEQSDETASQGPSRSMRLWACRRAFDEDSAAILEHRAVSR